jgi:type II secretory ATPase GspE/PulE/Tfp pilus assembly ATPase PilB-like protein/CheY-like chemotaxis protein
VARSFKVPVADLAAADARAATLVPEALARKHLVVPVAATDRIIRIATADPRDLNVEQSLAFVTGREVRFEVAEPDALAAKLDELYRPEKSINRLLSGLNGGSVEQIDETPLVDNRDPSLDAPMAKLVDAMIGDAVRERASDIHAEVVDGRTSVRYRVDGVLREVMRLPESACAALVRRVKILAKLDVTNALRPQDGRTATRVDGQPVDLRVSTLPIARRGEKVVIRILERSNLRNSLENLGLPEDEHALLRRMVGHREGMVLVTGPTGSGKTTTLYAMLNELKDGKVNIVTVEDPVEYDIAGVSQIQVNEAQGLTFATSLRSVLRQDPDIVLVGEIRDQETAKTAVQAGLSGHLVLSTLHTNDAPSAVVRLRDIGVDAFKVATVLKGIVAQRLVRRLCDACATPVPVDSLPPEARPPAGRAAIPRKAAGCKACNGLGYKGRLAVLELLPVDDAVARAIDSGLHTDAIAAAGRRAGMRTLWESGLLRVWSGQTSLDELVRVLGERVGEEIHEPPAAEPAVVPAPVQRAVAASPSAGSGAIRVLVADDDPQMRRLIRTVLEREGFEVIEAADGLDALDAVEQSSPGLVLLDMDMPRLDGMGVLEEIRARVRTATLPVIFLTAQTGDTEAQALELGADDFLAKPVQPRSLTARVRAVLKRAGS